MIKTNNYTEFKYPEDGVTALLIHVGHIHFIWTMLWYIHMLLCFH